MFFGRTYRYPTPNSGVQTIGVCTVLSGLSAVCWINQHGSRVRIRTSKLPVLTDAGKVQELLDAWAKDRGLEEVA